jgi:hypothetical protein
MLSLSACLGCALGGNSAKTIAFIDDGLTSNGFKIATVDGGSPMRSTHAVMTMVPYIIVEPGTHEFTVEGDSRSFRAKVEQGKRYRTAVQGGLPTLSEEPAARDMTRPGN